MAIALDRYIETSPDVRGGRPRIADTRLTVADVVVMYLRLGQSLEEIADYAPRSGDCTTPAWRGGVARVGTPERTPSRPYEKAMCYTICNLFIGVIATHWQGA